MFTTVHETDSAILATIIQLYCTLGFDVDATYSTGGFYRSGEVAQPHLRFDLNPQVPGVLQADCRDLSLFFEAESVGSMILDLPFIHAPGKNSIMGQRFSGFQNQKELRHVYTGAMSEASRILIKNGILAWKCQDIVEAGRQNWTHIFLADICSGAFEMIDLFVLGKRRVRGHNHGIQQHARKEHCYWLVFRKR